MKHRLAILLVLLVSVSADVNEVDRLFYSQQPPDGGYVYFPPQFEPPVLPPLYQPPIFAEEVPFVPTAITYLPPNDDTIVIPAQQPPGQGLVPPKFHIENMSCVQGVNFRALFKMAGDFPQFPVVDDASEGCIIPMASNMFKIDLESFNSMLKCGVKRCKGSKSEGTNDNMCVTVRLPTVRGVRLPEDGIVTLMCTPQERIVSQTRHVKLGGNKILQTSRGRSNNVLVATGGTQKDLKTRIGIFRKRPGNSIYDQSVLADSVIQLGEELVLRAVVNEGDGWKDSQIGPVIITGVNSKKTALLVNQQGCVNPVMRGVCSRQPLKINPLTTELYFRAFLFQESPQGDEMVVSVRTQGCLHPQDCIRACPDEVNPNRSKRELSINATGSSNKANSLELQTLYFKVQTTLNNNNPRKNDGIYMKLLCFSLLGMGISVLVIVYLLWHLHRRNKSSKT